jgi:hypothetical protein
MKEIRPETDFLVITAHEVSPSHGDNPQAYHPSKDGFFFSCEFELFRRHDMIVVAHYLLIEKLLI